MTRTSHSHPLAIAEVKPPGGGVVGVTFCPGKHQPAAMTGGWARDLGVDLQAIRSWGADVVITLVTDRELADLRVQRMGEAVRALGMKWLHLPITDVSTPTADWEAAWEKEQAIVADELDRNGRVLVHCKGGLGRAGLVAARILVERGMAPKLAVAAVRRVRPGAIETPAQESYVHALATAAGKQHDVHGESPWGRPAPTADGLPRPSISRAASADVGDRALGAFLGLAVGDALGTTLEFSARDSRPWHTEMTGGGPFRLPPGVWTDDTQMALALADSLVSVGGLDEHDLMTRFVRWWRHGEYSPTGRCFDIGNTTMTALARFERTGNPIAGDPDPHAAGNGSLMRLSPVAIFHRQEPEKAVEAARRQSATTHAAPECLEACAFFAGLLVRAIHGEPRDSVLAPSQWPDGGAVGEIAAGGWRSKRRDQIRSSGYVIHSLEAALWAVGNADSFEEAVVTAVNLGEDADTVGAITGQLAGALWGASAIPERWMSKLASPEKFRIFGPA